MMQQELFNVSEMEQQNPLYGRRVGFIGKFSNRASLIKKVKEYGASDKSKDGVTRDTQILVMGDAIKQEDLNRLCCYEHDGWKPLKISESELEGIFKGHFSGYETPLVPVKNVSIDFSYYTWTPPIIEDTGEEGSGVRRSSPLVYGDANPIYGMEIYVPERPNENMAIIRQIIGNFGGYATPKYDDDTNVIMLGEKTLSLLKQGVKDEVILKIEKQYNESSSRIFNIQFTSEPDFIEWVKKRMERFPDESTLSLLNRYLSGK